MCHPIHLLPYMCQPVDLLPCFCHQVRLLPCICDPVHLPPCLCRTIHLHPGIASPCTPSPAYVTLYNYFSACFTPYIFHFCLWAAAASSQLLMLSSASSCLHVTPCIFNLAPGNRFGRSHKSLLEAGKDEDVGKGMLSTSLRVMQQVHQSLFQASMT